MWVELLLERPQRKTDYSLAANLANPTGNFILQAYDVAGRTDLADRMNSGTVEKYQMEHSPGDRLIMATEIECFMNRGVWVISSDKTRGRLCAHKSTPNNNGWDRCQEPSLYFYMTPIALLWDLLRQSQESKRPMWCLKKKGCRYQCADTIYSYLLWIIWIKPDQT